MLHPVSTKLVTVIDNLTKTLSAKDKHTVFSEVVTHAAQRLDAMPSVPTFIGVDVGSGESYSVTPSKAVATELSERDEPGDLEND